MGVERTSYLEPFSASRGSKVEDVADAFSARHLFRPREAIRVEKGKTHYVRQLLRPGAECGRPGVTGNRDLFID
jgi:hypothetical protein